MLANACCCNPSCLIDSDDFDRANSNDIGGKWTDANARIVDNRLAQQTLGSMLVMTTKNHTSETMVVDVAITFTASSISLDKGIVIVNARDSNNYLFVQIEVSNSAFSGTAISTKLKFYRRSGGVNTQLGSTRTLDATNALNNQQVRVCYDGTYLSALGYREAATKITDGFKAGLSAEGSTTIYFNNFRWYKYSSECPNCIPNVLCRQCTQQATKTIVLDFGAGGLVDSNWNGCDEVIGEFLLTYGWGQQGDICFGKGVENCVWTYGRYPWGTGAHAFTLCSGPMSVCVWATVRWSFITPGKLQWWAYLQGANEPPCFNVNTTFFYATYYSAEFLETDCDVTPVTLTLQASPPATRLDNAFGTFACTGGFPATIELRHVT